MSLQDRKKYFKNRFNEAKRAKAGTPESMRKAIKKEITLLKKEMNRVSTISNGSGDLDLYDRLAEAWHIIQKARTDLMKIG
jgi:hypothetical protein